MNEQCQASGAGLVSSADLEVTDGTLVTQALSPDREAVGLGNRAESTVATTYNPFVPPQRDDPYPVWALARQIRPVFWSDVQGVWVVTRHDDICEVVRDTEHFSSADAIRPSRPVPKEVAEVLATGYSYEELRPLLTTDPPAHTRVRKLLGVAFTPRRVKALEPRVHEVARGLVKGFVDDGAADLVARFAYPLPLTIILELIGVPDSDREHVKGWSDDKVALQWGDMPLDEHVSHARGYVEFQKYMTNLVDARRAGPADDLISALTAARVDDEHPLATREVVAQMMGLISAGHETTTNLIAHAVLLLLEHGLWEEVRAEPSIVPAAVEETLRFDSPVMGMMRTATVDVEVAGVRIKTGDRLQLMYGSANRDAGAFPDPDGFDVRREHASHHLAFGRGAHFCLGAALARIEGRIAIEVLTDQLEDVRLTAPPVWHPNAAFRGPLSVELSWRRRR